MTDCHAGEPCAIASSSRGVLNAELQRKRGLDSTTDASVRPKPKQMCSGGATMRPTKQDIFSASTEWVDLTSASGEHDSAEVSAALRNVAHVSSQNIREATRLSYTQVYNQIVKYAATLNPPVHLDIQANSIPPSIIISFFRVLFTGKNHEVLGEDGTPILCNDGKPRLGRGFAESTFRKYYHALNTLHKHFRKEHSYRVDESGNHTGNSCQEPSVVRVYNGYLKMFHDPLELGRYGRKMEGPVTARIFKIRDLLALHDLTRRQPQAYILRGWTYILLSCALFLRKSEAANLMISDLSVPRDAVTGKLLLESGLPKVIVVHIRRSKTDQTGQGQRLLLRRNYKNPKLCPVIALMTWLAVLRKKYGVDRGAVLPNLTKGSCGKPLVKEAFRKMLHQLVKKAEIETPGLRTHSCRRTAAYYAAWLGIPEATIKLLGRWESHVYVKYVETADLDKREWRETSGDQPDPINEHFNVFGSLCAQ